MERGTAAFVGYERMKKGGGKNSVFYRIFDPGFFILGLILSHSLFFHFLYSHFPSLIISFLSFFLAFPIIFPTPPFLSFPTVSRGPFFYP